MPLLEWPPTRPRTIADNVYGSINLPHPLQYLVDSEEMQRLRELKQTGLVYLVYPASEHSRFVHSLGAYHLAFELVKTLRERQKYLEITSEDHLCTCIGALLHDVGHGPFSHLFDGDFAKAVGRKWKHEDMSVRLIRRLMFRSEIREQFEPYLGAGEDYERNVQFIVELIGSKRFKENTSTFNRMADTEARHRTVRRSWQMEGRTIEKSFLYDVVSNEHDGHDVDKMDYLLRDSLAVQVSITFSLNSVRRMFENVKVVADPDLGFRRIGYNVKVRDVVKSIGDSRQELHSKVYQHTTVRGIENILVDAMVTAGKHMKFEGDDGNLYDLAHVIDDCGAYLKATDSVYREILNSHSSEMADAREKLKQLQRRVIPIKVANVEVSPSKAKQMVDANDHPTSSEILEHIRDCMHLPEDLADKCTLLTRVMGRGLDAQTHPIERQLFFDAKKCVDDDVQPPEGFYLDEEFVRLNCPQDATKWELVILGDRSLTLEERNQIEDAFMRVVSDMRLVSPQKRTGVKRKLFVNGMEDIEN